MGNKQTAVTGGECTGPWAQFSLDLVRGKDRGLAEWLQQKALVSDKPGCILALHVTLDKRLHILQPQIPPL